MSWEAGRTNDSKSEVLDKTPPPGSVSIFDLGYFSLERFRQWQAAVADWISRGISDLLVTVDGQTHDLHEWLGSQPPGVIDRWVEIGAARLCCRIIALRAPTEVASRRCRQARGKALTKGRQPTARHLATCDWTVFLTSCSNELLSWKEVVVLYRLRWRIELLFKLCRVVSSRPHNALADHRSENPVRQLVELYSRMIAVVIQHWLVITTSWGDARLSLTKATRLIRDELPQLIPSQQPPPR